MQNLTANIIIDNKLLEFKMKVGQSHEADRHCNGEAIRQDQEKGKGKTSTEFVEDKTKLSGAPKDKNRGKLVVYWICVEYTFTRNCSLK
jgi:hypothetical protein